MNRLLCLLSSLVCYLLLVGISQLHAQEDPGWSKALEEAREKEDSKQDTIIYSSRFVRYTTLEMMRQATYTFQIDTVHKNFQYYNPQLQPKNPSIHLGSYGLATRDLLFTPDRSIGFRTGFHALERFLYTSDEVKY